MSKFTRSLAPEPLVLEGHQEMLYLNMTLNLSYMNLCHLIIY